MHQKGLTLVFRGAFLVDGGEGAASRTRILRRLEDVVAVASSRGRGGAAQPYATRPYHHIETATASTSSSAPAAATSDVSSVSRVSNTSLLCRPS